MITRPLLVALVAIVATPLSSGFSPLSGAELVYGLTERGRLSVNGTVLDSLDSEFQPGDPTFAHQRWNDLMIDGDDRYVLRRDGLLFRNGKRLEVLPYSPSLDFQWISLAVNDGRTWAVRQDGAIAVGGVIQYAMPIADDDENLFAFRQIINVGNDVYGLRADGAVYKNNIDTPVVKFTGGNGVDGLPDGFSQFGVWTAMVVSSEGDLFALRSDGKIHKVPFEDVESADDTSGDTGPAHTGEIEAQLPFPAFPAAADFYLDLEVLANGDWVALQADGRIYTDDSGTTPFVDYPGNATNADNFFVDVTTFENTIFAVRTDGKVYRGAETDVHLLLPKRPYSRIAVTSTPPNLDNFKNQKPTPALYKVIALEGEAVSVPVVVTDGDKPAGDLLVTPVDVPTGAVWDAESRTLAWDSPGPVGGHTFSVAIDDGVAKPKTFKYKLKVIALDSIAEKNKPPAVSKIKKIQALVGYEISLSVIAVDPDGDDLTMSVNESKFPFTAGATFDAETGVFTWTPEFDDIGKHKVQVNVSDGVKTKKVKLKITVINPLIFE